MWKQQKMKTNNIMKVGLVIIGIVVILVFLVNSADSKQQITVYKSSSCGCCGGYVGELEKEGFKVKTIINEDINPIKEKYNIPLEMQSCHTSVIEGYFLEGHVPLEAVNKMLDEKPDIEGLMLPGMEPGAPGMPGEKEDYFIVYSLKNGEIEEFMTV